MPACTTKRTIITSIIFFHVNDLIICGNEESTKEIIDKLQAKFEIHNLGYPSEIQGIQIKLSTNGIHILTTKTEKTIISDFEMGNAKLTFSPLPPG